MGWYFVALVAWGTTLMVIVGLFVNNIQRQFPIYWWTPLDIRRAKKQDIETVPDARGGVERRETEEEQKYDQQYEKIEITGAEVILPEALSLNKDEAELEGRDLETDSSSAKSSTEFTMVPTRSEGARSNSDSSRSRGIPE
jgi:cytidylate kinase